MNRITYNALPNNGSNYDAAMKSVLSLVEVDRMPHKFRFDVRFEFLSGQVVGFKMRVYELEEDVYVTEVRNGDIDAMRALVRTYQRKKPKFDDVFTSFF